MHETGFKTALTRVINNYGQKNNIIKGDDKVSGDDVREGIAAVISVKLPEAQFEGQTKQKLGNAYIRTLVDNIVSEQLATYFEEHPAVAKAVAGLQERKRASDHDCGIVSSGHQYIGRH